MAGHWTIVCTVLSKNECHNCCSTNRDRGPQRNTLAGLNINRQTPHPSTSPAYCLDPPVCISTGGVFVVSQHSLIYLSKPWLLWLESKTESWALVMSWKLVNSVLNAAKDNGSDTDGHDSNSLFSFRALFLLFCSQGFLLCSFLPIRQAVTGSQRAFWPQAQRECKALSSPPVLLLFYVFFTTLHLFFRQMNGDDSPHRQMCFYLSSQRIHLDVCVTVSCHLFRFPTGWVWTCRWRLVHTCLQLHTLHHPLSIWVLSHFMLAIFYLSGI